MAFIGFEEEYDQYKKENGGVSQELVDTGEINTVAYDDMDPISDEDLDILKHTITRHDPLKVYMHSDTSFYDSFYHEDEENIDPLLQEARGIRRLYKNIPDYKYAMYIRELYIQSLVEKYGGEDMYLLLLHGGMIEDWVPPVPILSKHADGYDLYIQGIEDMDINDYDSESILRILGEYEESVDVDDMNIIGDVETRREVLIAAETVGQEHQAIRFGGTNSNINGVSVNDLTGLQQMFTSWYNDDVEKSSQDQSVDKSKFFRATPEAIRKSYYSMDPVSSGGVLEKLLETNGNYDLIEHENMSEMVIDDVTRLPMTRGEMYKRKFIRKLSENGWNDVRLMRRMSVGSEYELRILDQKQKKNKIAKKKARSLMDTMMGTDALCEVNTIDELDRLMFND